MKKLMMLVLALALSISCLAIPAGAVELEENQADAYMTIQQSDNYSYRQYCLHQFSHQTQLLSTRSPFLRWHCAYL